MRHAQARTVVLTRWASARFRERWLSKRCAARSGLANHASRARASSAAFKARMVLDVPPRVALSPLRRCSCVRALLCAVVKKPLRNEASPPIYTFLIGRRQLYRSSDSTKSTVERPPTQESAGKSGLKLASSSLAAQLFTVHGDPWEWAEGCPAATLSESEASLDSKHRYARDEYVLGSQRTSSCDAPLTPLTPLSRPPRSLRPPSELSSTRLLIVMKSIHQ